MKINNFSFGPNDISEQYQEIELLFSLHPHFSTNHSNPWVRTQNIATEGNKFSRFHLIYSQLYISIHFMNKIENQ